MVCLFVCLLGVGEWRTTKTDMSELFVSSEYMAHVQASMRFFPGNTQGMAEQIAGPGRNRKGLEIFGYS